jgi:4-amino-4-deoxy-L-arabinose transferase-like glycosyltransferase
MNLRPLHAYLLLLAVSALLYLPATGVIPLMDRDEPRFAHATVEMMQRGEWIIPYFNSDPAETNAERLAQMRAGKSAMDVGYRFDKPPLTYWWMRLHFALLGVNEFAARLHSVLSVAFIAWILYAMGRRLHSSDAGLIAGLAWLTSMQALAHGRLCVADMPMVLCVTLSEWALLELLQPPDQLERRRFGRWFWVLWISLGLGFLAKGPIAWLVPGLGLLLWRWVLWKKAMPWSRLQWRAGLGLSLAIIAAWGIPALVITEGLFWRVGMGEHVVQRGTQAFNGRVIIPFYYIGAALFSLMPWVAWLPEVWRQLRADWSGRMSFLLSWFLAPQLIFFFYATQLPHYVMPGFPAFFLVLGITLAGLWEEGIRKMSAFGWCYIVGLLALAAVIMCAAGSGAFGVSGDLRSLLGAIGILLLSLGMIGLSGFFGQRWLGLAATISLAASLHFSGSFIRSIHPVVGMQPLLVGKGEALAWQFTEPSLVYYGDRHWKYASKLAKVEAQLKKGQPEVVVCLGREWTLNRWLQNMRSGASIAPDRDNGPELDKLNASAAGYAMTTVSGLNLARTSWVEFRVWKRSPAKVSP